MEEKKKNTKARNRANMKFAKENYDRIALTVKKGNRQIIKDFAGKQGYSINGFINKLLSDAVEGFISFDDMKK